MIKDSSPKGLGIVVYPPSQTGQHDFIFKVALFDFQSPYFFLGSDDIPVDEVDFLLFSSGVPEEISLDLVNKVSDFLG